MVCVKLFKLPDQKHFFCSTGGIEPAPCVSVDPLLSRKKDYKITDFSKNVGKTPSRNHLVFLHAALGFQSITSYACYCNI